MFKKVSAIIVLVNTYKTIKYLVNYKELNILKKKIKYKIAIPTVIVLVLLSYIFLTPIGALRFAVFREAFTSYETTLKGREDLLLATITLDVDYSNDCRPSPIDKEGNKMLYYIKDAPVEPLTQTPWDMWEISKYGIFYWGEVYWP